MITDFAAQLRAVRLFKHEQGPDPLAHSDLDLHIKYLGEQIRVSGTVPEVFCVWCGKPCNSPREKECETHSICATENCDGDYSVYPLAKGDSRCR